MKQKLTVLACVGLALLLSTGFAFAQNTITVVSGDVDRCATVTTTVTLDNLSDEINAIGLPLIVTNGILTGVAAGPALSGQLYAINHQGNRVLLNAACSTPCLPIAGPHTLLTLTIETPVDCQGAVTIGLDPDPMVDNTDCCGSLLVLADCDACEVPVDFIPGALTLVNQDPICGANADVNMYFGDAIVGKVLNASDPDPCDNPLAYSWVSGPGGPTSVTPTGEYSWDPSCQDVGDHTVVFRATDQCGGYVECPFDITVYQNPPTCQDLPLNIVHWRDMINEVLPGQDDACLWDPPVWTLIDVVPPVVGAIAVGNGPGDDGLLTYQAECLDIGMHHAIWQIDDGEFQAQCSKDIEVYNNAPTIVCPTPVDPSHLCNHQWVGGADGIFNLGDLVEGQAIGNDPDPQDIPFLEYSVVSVEVEGLPYVPVNAPTIGLANGWFSWQSDGNDAVGTYDFVLEITDGCWTAQCHFSIEVELNMYMAIRGNPGAYDTIPALPGQQVCVYVEIFPNIDLGGMDILLCYDMTGLQFLTTQSMLDLADWEYFTYRTAVDGNCSGACPTGYIRIVSIADMDNGPAIHPPAGSFGLEGNVIELCFQVTSDWNFLGMCLPINFCTLDCGDNVLASKDGNITYLPLGSDPECLENVQGKPLAIEEIELCGGAICVREPEDDRGDINLNGVTNEISDAVLFSRYFIEGDGVWDPIWYMVQIQATDVNNDGVPLTVADLVYLIRVITGDEMPFPSDEGNPKVSPYAGQADAIVKVSNGNVSVTTNSAVDLGGALFVFRYSGMGVGEAVASEAAENMVVKSRSARGELRVLVAPNMANLGTIEAGTHEVVNIPTSGAGTIDLVEVQLADAHGAMLTSNMAKISPPKSYALMQNYPNPFNAGTVIRFDLSQESDWTLQVYNITGQVVRTFSGHDAPSTVSVTWDGANRDGNQAASGVYFYRINAGEYTATKKMTLLK